MQYQLTFLKLMLKAPELGLGSVWVCYFKPDVLKNEFVISANLDVVNILAVGYLDENAAPVKDMKDMDKFAFFEKL